MPTSYIRKLCGIAYFLKVLALQLLNEGRKALLIGVNSHGFEKGLDVIFGGRRVSTKGEEEISCEMLHFGCWEIWSVQYSDIFKEPRQRKVYKHLYLFLEEQENQSI